jgi:hypothetical protein
VHGILQCCHIEMLCCAVMCSVLESGLDIGKTRRTQQKLLIFVYCSCSCKAWKLRVLSHSIVVRLCCFRWHLMHATAQVPYSIWAQYFHIKMLQFNSNVPISQCVCVSCHLVAVSWIPAFSWFCEFVSPAIWWLVHETATWVCDRTDRSRAAISSSVIITSRCTTSYPSTYYFFSVAACWYCKVPLNCTHRQ